MRDLCSSEKGSRLPIEHLVTGSIGYDHSVDFPPDIPPDLLHEGHQSHHRPDDDVRAPMEAKFDTLYGTRDPHMLAAAQAAQYGLNRVHKEEPTVRPAHVCMHGQETCVAHAP